MKTFFRYGFTAFVFYATINWVADNPAKVNYIRKQVNKSVDAGLEQGNEIVEEATK